MKKKTGITMAMLVVIVAVMSILTTVTITSISNSYNNSKLSIWVTEIGLIEDLMKEHKANVSSILMDAILFDVSNINSNIKTEQFSGETITNNKIVYIENTVFQTKTVFLFTLIRTDAQARQAS